MNRMTSDNTFEMDMYQLALNQVYIGKDGWAQYVRSPEEELSVCDLILTAAETLHVELPILSDEALANLMTDFLPYGEEEPEGVLAILYRALWAMAERTRLSRYEDTGLEPEEIMALTAPEANPPLTIEQLQGMEKTEIALALVKAERQRQESLWGDQSGNHPFEWMAILGEEYGELCEAVNETCFSNAAHPEKGGCEKIMREAVHVAAVTVAIIEAMKAAPPVGSGEAIRTKSQPTAPLTLEELRKMDGEPVWLATSADKPQWAFVVYDHHEEFISFKEPLKKSDIGVVEEKKRRTGPKVGRFKDHFICCSSLFVEASLKRAQNRLSCLLQSSPRHC